MALLNDLRSRFAISLALLLSLLIFVIPLLGAVAYSFKGSGGRGYSFTNYDWLVHQDGFWPNLIVSLKLSLLAGILNLILMVPTMVYLHLRGQRFKHLVDFLCVLPLVIPVVSLAIGAQIAMPRFLQNTEYELVFFFVVISLPFTFRSLDTALSSIPLKIYVEASRSLGGSWVTTIFRVIIPSIRSGITSALFLCFALALGEYTITSLLHWDTFPTWTVVAAQQNILGAIAISVFSFIGAVGILAFIALISLRKNSRSQIFVDQEEIK